MNIQDLAREEWTDKDVKEMLRNVMDIAKGGSLRHVKFVFDVLTYEAKSDDKGQLKIPFNEGTTVTFRHYGTK